MAHTLWVKNGEFPEGYRSVADKKALGKDARAAVPRSSHAQWSPAPDRRDPVSLLEEQNADRVDWLVPIRHARMRVSPFTFYRGTARIMASDLAGSPVSGLNVQLGGDAHLSNFGAYASSERHLVFDANDFDETLPGPWSGTSSGWRRVSWWPVNIWVSRACSSAKRPKSRSGPTGRRCALTRSRATWTSGTTTFHQNR